MKRLVIVLFMVGAGNLSAQSWQPMGLGMRDFFEADVRTISVDPGSGFIVAGGAFDSAGLVKSRNLAFWDGTEWLSADSVKQSPFKEIYSMYIYQNQLLVNDENGKIWIMYDTSVVGSMPNPGGITYAMTEYQGSLYAGGEFGIKQWDGIQWNAVGGNIGGLGDLKVRSLCVYDGKLIIAGSFDYVNGFGIPENNIVAWDGTQWLDLGAGLKYDIQFGTEVLSLAVFQNNLYASGVFDSAGSVAVDYIAKWDGNQWSSFATPCDGYSWSIFADSNTLYFGGSFNTISGLSVGNIAKWDGLTWNTMDGGIGGQILCINKISGKVYAGGFFYSTYQGIYANSIAYYDDITSVPVSLQLDFTLYPNPSSDVLHLKLPPSTSSITILNSLGQQVLQLQAKEEEDIDVSQLPAGIYLLRVKTATSEQTAKFVKE